MFVYKEPRVLYRGTGDQNSLLRYNLFSIKCKYCSSERKIEGSYETLDGGLAGCYLTLYVCSVCGFWSIQSSYTEDDSLYEYHAYLVGELFNVDPKSSSIPLKSIARTIQKEYRRINQVSPRNVERLIASIFTEVFDCEVALTKQTRDQGIDLIGMDSSSGKFIVEIKRWRDKVDISIVQRMAGVLYQMNIDRGLIVTTGSFSKPAIQASEEINQAGDVLWLELKDCKDVMAWLGLLNRKYDSRERAYILGNLPPRTTFTQKMDNLLFAKRG